MMAIFWFIVVSSIAGIIPRLVVPGSAYTLIIVLGVAGAFIADPAWAGEKCGVGSCPEGYQCSPIRPGKCVPFGNLDCGGYTCSPGNKCGRGVAGKCIPQNSVDCGDGRYCNPGFVCAAGSRCISQADLAAEKAAATINTPSASSTAQPASPPNPASPPVATNNPPSTFGEIVQFDCNQLDASVNPPVVGILIKILYPSEKRQQFADPTFTQDLLDSIRNAATQRCSTVPAQFLDGGRSRDARRTKFELTIGATRDFGWYVGNAQNIYVRASFDLQTQKWTLVHNAAGDSLAQARREQEQQQAEARKSAEEVAEFERRKQAALADCGSNWPTLISGPWFSTTYKTAAIDGARRSNYLCVKSIEYLGAAPNPFGLNSAKARLIFYTNNAIRQTQDIDFFY
ncbi:hypothetical protein SAMN05216338_1003323 [Bradyrhizobium sp. Rc2d]|uniref:GlsB/YeaQ/YmgE family stress response membrane protein n=1 Tax=Bradyrhizobium sp. Rc2d TaxID=1855321 RepID=UPI00087FD2A9|nr:GlsB/YeaQ/YmgE family stress response membrane protein [Bradyrhizobium sp. Rc2d]SDG88527.1 hypothetical protein SAMN05216338_1003323 [Bradyrhizobium sp. Rc2d]